ncbi:MAG: helix-turn-helix domain-containing protein [Clostridiales bacterium]|nr:helix-turn-helix domain-containing protein [Clostridiales bacterium]
MNEEMREGVEIPEIQDIDMFRFVYAFQPMVTESHEDAFELLYLKSGQKPFKIGNREWTLVGGDLAVIPPGVEHGQNSVQNRSSLYFMLLSEPEKCENFLFMDQTARCELQKRLLKCAGRPIHLPPVVQKSFQQLLDMQKGDAPESQSLLAPALVRAHLTLLLESILACGEGVEAPLRTLPPDIARAVDYMEQCRDTTPSVSELAAMAGLSEVWFKQKFKRAVGMPPAEYCLRHKLGVAAQQLLNTKYSITRIAMSLGFSSGQHFSTAFRHYLGCSPSDYRKSGGEIPELDEE